MILPTSSETDKNQQIAQLQQAVADLLQAVADLQDERNRLRANVSDLARRKKVVAGFRDEFKERASELKERVSELEKVLARHHKWHNEIGVVFFKEDGEFIELDLSVEYSDSTLCADTMKVLP